MPTLVVRHPDGSETEHELSGELTIGRQEGNDLILTEGGVSRQHARLIVDGAQVLLEDLGSANGTYVNEERISEPTPLTPQSQVVLGDYALKLKGAARAPSGARRAAKPSTPEVGAEEGAPRATRAMPSVRPARTPGSALAKRERPAPGAAAAGAGPVLRGLTGPWANKTFPIKSKLLVGRAPPAAVMLEDDSISRKHAELERNPQGVVYVRDLGSANGTLINGDRIGQEPVEVSAGDIIQFGMVEMVYESGDASGASPRKGRAGGAAAGKGDPSDAPPGAARSKKLLVGAGAAVGLMLVVGIVLKVTAVPDQTGPVGPPPPPTQESLREKVQELLSECRSFTSMEMGNEPKWDKASAKCEEALNLDPINKEANEMVKFITMEKEASEYYIQGSKMLQRLKEDDALDLLRKIPKESKYFRSAKIKVDEAMEQVKKRSLDDCKSYLRDNQWAAAVPRCDRFMGFWCQGINREELEPPLGFKLSLEGRVGKKQWRPKDKLFVQFLSARRKLDPQVEDWKCPVTDFGAKEVVEGPEGQVKKMFKDRYPNPYMNSALFDYWGGRGNEALAKLQKVRSNYEQASLHGQVDELIKAVSNVEQLFKTGSSALQVEDVEKAAEPFDEALGLDKQLMGDMWERAPSFYRHNIQQDMADKAFTRGKDWGKREDMRRACKVWKIGFRFYKGNTDLIRVLSNNCSTRGAQLFAEAGSCRDLSEVAEWAVPGDGLEERMVKKREELNCK